MLGIFLDTETNGLNAQKHRILEVAFQIVDVESGVMKEQFHSMVYSTAEEWKRSDPESLKVNGFTWEEVSVGPSPALIGEKIREVFSRNGIKRGEAVFICQNPSFDRAFFSQLIDPDIAGKTPVALPLARSGVDVLGGVDEQRALRAREISPGKRGTPKTKSPSPYSSTREAKAPPRDERGRSIFILCYKAVVGFPKESIDFFV